MVAVVQIQFADVSFQHNFSAAGNCMFATAREQEIGEAAVAQTWGKFSSGEGVVRLNWGSSL